MFRKKIFLKIFSSEKVMPLKGAFVGALEERDLENISNPNVVGRAIYHLDNPNDLRLLADLIENWELA